jgi:hypothetical protein
VQFLNFFEHGLHLFQLSDDVRILSEVLFAHDFDHEGIPGGKSDRAR